MNPSVAPYLSPLFQRVTGPALRPGGLELTAQALDWCGLSPGDRVLDLGCGLGASAAFMASERGLRVIGLDLSFDMLASARQEHGELPMVRATAQALPLAKASLDGVLCECVLSLSADPAWVLREVCRVLRPGGWLMLSDLYLRGPHEDWASAPLPGCLAGALDQPGVPALAEAAGLEVKLWEDHSARLRELAARLAWEYGSATAWWGGCDSSEDCAGAAEQVARARPGYFLMAARKRMKSNG